MKKTICGFLACLMLLSVSMTAFASSPQDILISSTEEILDNGDYIKTEVYLYAFQPYSGTSGYTTKTYYNSTGRTIFDVTVSGTFTYTYGSSSTATSSTASVGIYEPSTTAFVSKNAWTSGNTAYASGTVNYIGTSKTMTVSLSCDKYGNLYY